MSISKQYAGTFSRGTLRAEDLLRSFLDFVNNDEIQRDLFSQETGAGRFEALHDLQDLAAEADYLIHQIDYAEELEYQEDLERWTERAAQFWAGPVFEMLCDLVPPGYRFGTLSGDGAHYGFWRCENEKVMD